MNDERSLDDSMMEMMRQIYLQEQVCDKCHGYGTRAHCLYPARKIKCWDCNGTGKRRNKKK